MIGLLLTEKNSQKISVKYFLLTFFVCLSMVAWLGISDLRADEDDPDNNSDEYEVRFQNAAQAQRTDNVARQAALQDPLFNDLIDQGRYKAARAVYLGKVETLSRQISRMRANGMGWGDIVHKINVEYNYELHPSVLGLGHSPKSFKESVHHSKHSYKKSKSKMVQKDSDLAYADSRLNNQGKGHALGHSKDKNSNRGGGHDGGNGGSKGGGNGGGKGNKK
jgi:uncharacterized membrane protein YgcG